MVCSTQEVHVKLGQWFSNLSVRKSFWGPVKIKSRFLGPMLRLSDSLSLDRAQERVLLGSSSFLRCF